MLAHFPAFIAASPQLEFFMALIKHQTIKQ
jgi:hypothetical protein